MTAEPKLNLSLGVQLPGATLVLPTEGPPGSAAQALSLWQSRPDLYSRDTLHTFEAYQQARHVHDTLQRAYTRNVAAHLAACPADQISVHQEVLAATGRRSALARTVLITTAITVILLTQSRMFPASVVVLLGIHTALIGTFLVRRQQRSVAAQHLATLQTWADQERAAAEINR